MTTVKILEKTEAEIKTYSFWFFYTALTIYVDSMSRILQNSLR